MAFGLAVAYVASSHGFAAFYAMQMAVILSILAYNWMGAHMESALFRKLFHAVNGILERDDFRMAGEAAALFSASISVVYWLFGREAAIASCIVWAIGDGTASIVGMRMGKKGKSKEGMAAFIIFSAVAMAALLPWKLPGMAVVVIGSAVAEYLSGGVNDNITVPLAAGLLYILAF
jgi:dolichol kinase